MDRDLNVLESLKMRQSHKDHEKTERTQNMRFPRVHTENQKGRS